MALPKLKTPIYELKLPSSGESVLFTTFTVLDEKILLMAQDDEDVAQIRALRQVIDHCLLPDANGKKLDVAKLATFDLDYIWLKLRSKSVAEIVNLPFECRNRLPEGETREVDGEVFDHCGQIVYVSVNLDHVQVKKDPENNPRIPLQDGIGIKLRYPTFETATKIAAMEDDHNVDTTFQMVMDCIEMIYEGDKTYEIEHVDPKELQAFLESLSAPMFAKIVKFFETIPVLSHNVHFRCSKCKHELDITLEGTRSFLA